MNKKDMILSCIYNKCDLAEKEFDEYMNFILYHNVDEVDMLEHMILKIRRDTLREVLRDIMHNLSLTRGK